MTLMSLKKKQKTSYLQVLFDKLESVLLPMDQVVFRVDTSW